MWIAYTARCNDSFVALHWGCGGYGAGEQGLGDGQASFVPEVGVGRRLWRGCHPLRCHMLPLARLMRTIGGSGGGGRALLSGWSILRGRGVQGCAGGGGGGAQATKQLVHLKSPSVFRPL